MTRPIQNHTATDNRVLALLYLAGWNITRVGQLFNLGRSVAYARVMTEARLIGITTLPDFRAQSDKYRALIEREAQA